MSVFKVPEGTSHLTSFKKEDLVFVSPIKREKENMGRFKVKAKQTYIIVCSLENPNYRNEFNLSVYFDQALRDVEIMRVFHPDDKNKKKEECLPKLIPEEAEKLVNKMPLWKMELVKDSLQFMITDEDQEINF